MQPRQMISFRLNFSSAARLIPSRRAVHSCEYGFSLESSSSLGELSLETTSSLVFRTFTGFTWLRFGRGPSPSQLASALVGGWMEGPLSAQPLRANTATNTNNNRLLMATTRVSRIRADGLVASPVVVNFFLAPLAASLPARSAQPW